MLAWGPGGRSDDDDFIPEDQFKDIERIASKYGTVYALYSNCTIEVEIERRATIMVLTRRSSRDTGSCLEHTQEHQLHISALPCRTPDSYSEARSISAILAKMPPSQ